MKIHQILSVLAVCAAAPSFAAMTVAASVPDFASIASAIGGDRVEAFSVAKANNNPHSVEVLPSYMIRVARAKVYLKVGLGLDGWADAIVSGSRNRSIEVVDCSKGIEVLEKPTGKVDASMGDVHPEGNPHFWLDPRNGQILARTIADALEKADPSGSGAYEAGLAKFLKDLEARRTGWEAKMVPFKGQAIFTYHSSWPYFAKAFGLRIAGKVEPVPGIPPNARHLSELIELAKADHVKLLLQEPYFPDEGGKFLNRQCGIAVLKLAPSCTGTGPTDYLSHFDQLVDAIAAVK